MIDTKEKLFEIIDLKVEGLRNKAIIKDAVEDLLIAIKKQCNMHVVSRSTKIKINEPFEIEDFNEKYIAEINNFEDKDGLWEKEIIITKID